jgi:uncharacterized membrane protein YphA (DoxX/SURF4 family)
MDFLAQQSGRIIFASPFILFGSLQLIMCNFLNTITGSQTSSSAILWIVLASAAMIASGIAIALNKMHRNMALGLALLLLLFIALIHAPMLGNESTKGIALTNLLLDMILAGASLMFAGLAKPQS